MQQILPDRLHHKIPSICCCPTDAYQGYFVPQLALWGFCVPWDRLRKDQQDIFIIKPFIISPDYHQSPREFQRPKQQKMRRSRDNDRSLVCGPKEAPIDPLTEIAENCITRCVIKCKLQIKMQWLQLLWENRRWLNLAKSSEFTSKLATSCHWDEGMEAAPPLCLLWRTQLKLIKSIPVIVMNYLTLTLSVCTSIGNFRGSLECLSFKSAPPLLLPLWVNEQISCPL